jgi:glycogen debranching enzyme
MNPAGSMLPATDEVTVLAGSSFCRAERNGDIQPHRAQGVFVRDTRIVSEWELLLDDRPLEALGVVSVEPFAATFLTRAATRPGLLEPTVLVERNRMMGEGMREDIVVRNFGRETLGATLVLAVGSDFADLFDVKEGRAKAPGSLRQDARDDHLDLSVTVEGRRRGVRIVGHGGRAGLRTLTWRLAVPPQGEWRTTVEVLPRDTDHHAASPFPLDRPVASAHPARRMSDWRAGTPEVTTTDPLLQAVLDRSLEDLGALRMPDPEHPELEIVAAGAPWFMALFGRDSLLTSWLTLAWDPGIARGTLHTLARLQGTRVDPHSEEEPGRILHEVRLGVDENRALGGSSRYYGSVDATPLFVILLEAAAQWGLAEEDVAALLPAADRALAWIEEYGDIDGDGFVEYQRKTDRGLLNQGWKDSEDALTFWDGRPATGPIAVVEVQGYVYGAYLARARLADRAGDAATAQRCRAAAERLRQRFDEAFWLPEKGYYAVALDGEKRPVDALASNQGHCLWTGIVRPERAEPVVAQLMSRPMFSGWGVRTLADTMAAFNPVSYHNGSVWPHDNALLAHGLVRYGYVEEAATVAVSVVEAAAHFGHRLPELFCGFDRRDVPTPVPYPTSCSPQAWAAATPIGLLSALLALTPDADAGVVTATDHLPPQWGRLRLDGLTLGEKRATVEIG